MTEDASVNLASVRQDSPRQDHLSVISLTCLKVRALRHWALSTATVLGKRSTGKWTNAMFKQMVGNKYKLLRS